LKRNNQSFTVDVAFLVSESSLAVLLCFECIFFYFA